MPLCDIATAAERTCLSKSTIYKAVMNRRIPFIKLGGKLLFDPDVLDAWIRENSHPPAETTQ
jgi:excisionase family DNA binding protein